MPRWLTRAATVALALTLWSPAQASQRIIERYLTTTVSGVQTSLYHYSRNDTTTIQTDKIPAFGARFVKFVLWTDAAQAYTLGDSVYSDSLRGITFQLSENDTNFVQIKAGEQNLGAYHVEPAQLDSSTTNVLSMSSIGGRLVWLVPFNSDGNNTRTMVPPVLTCRNLRMNIRCINRNSLSGAVATQGGRTKGLRGLTVKAYYYYDLP